MEQTKKEDFTLRTPFQNIGLAFSGGGFRAASFSLGTLSYLNHIQTNSNTRLLQHVSFISSASGGTITNTLFTACLHKGIQFEQFYKTLLAHLSGENILEKVLAVLNDDKEWYHTGNGKERNLINAFAKVYDSVIFQGETLAVYWNKSFVPEFEVCFNATEFYRGLSFRFQTSGNNNPYQVTGNNYLWFDTDQMDTIKKIKLADILAASSCFPMGFEPIVYPYDFTYNEKAKCLTETELKDAVFYENYNEKQYRLSGESAAQKEWQDAEDETVKKIESFGLMDGGITDNQGLNSLMLADKKRRKRVDPHPFDLMIVTDVASYFMNAYAVPDAKDAPDWRKKDIAYFIHEIKKYGKWFTITLMVFALALAVFIGIEIFGHFSQTIRNIVWVAVGFIGALLCIAGFVYRIGAVRRLVQDPESFDLKSFLKNAIHIEKYFTDSIISKLIRFLKLTRLGVLEQMLKARISSVMTMMSDVNLKQVRRLIYQMFYDEPMWDNRRMPNFIYELSTYNISARTNRLNSSYRLKWKATDADKKLLLSDCSKLNTIAEEARLTSTTLWFDEQDMQQEKLKKIVATGQFTTCVNLLEYIISLERKELIFDTSVREQLNFLKQELIMDWGHFKKDPYFLYDLLSE